jgi:hypothetical protein
MAMQITKGKQDSVNNFWFWKVDNFFHL